MFTATPKGLEVSMKCKSIVTLCLVAFFTAGFVGCTSNGQPDGSQSQSQRAQDQKTREKVAEVTQKAKNDSEHVVLKADQAAKDLEHKAEIVKQGVKEGWNGGTSQPVNLNSASETDLQSLPGINHEDAQRIIRGRPYASKNELVDKKIISEDEFGKIEARITVK
jgi:DNA uptake protein ComE-like DNA-binding protein